MHRRARSIQLSKETLRNLDPEQLRAHVAAGGNVAVRISQEGDSCLQSCFINTCYDTCDWTGKGGAIQPAGAA